VFNKPNNKVEAKETSHKKWGIRLPDLSFDVDVAVILKLKLTLQMDFRLGYDKYVNLL
jgi:hypothetical protein